MTAPVRFWPLAAGRIITSPFGPRSGGMHTGVDFGWPGGSAGQPVYAIQAGTVIFAGAAQGYGGPDPAGWLVIDSTDAEGGGCLEYGHIIREVALGARVAAGQRIGRINPDSGTNGGVAPHLHVSDMPYAYNPATKQDVMPRLAGAREPGQPPPKETTVPALPAFDYGITKVMHGFNPSTCAKCTGNSSGPRAQTLYIVVHTQQSRSTAVNLASFCNNSRISQPTNPVSYNLAVDDKDTIEIVPVIEAPWSAGEANGIALHICFAGSLSEWTAGKWLETDASDGLNEDAMLTRGARAAAAACKQFGIPAVYAGDGGRTGWPILPKGIVGHRDFGRRGGGHTDPGDGFPMTEFLRRVNNFLNPPTPGGAVPAPTNDQKLDYVYGQLQPYPQLAGKPAALDDLRRKIAAGVDLTLVDAFAAHIHGLFAPKGGA